MTRREILEAAAEIVSLETFGPEFGKPFSDIDFYVDHQATVTVQCLAYFKEKISYPDAEYEKWVD